MTLKEVSARFVKAVPLPGRHAGTCIIPTVYRKCGAGTQDISVTVRLHVDPHGAQSAGGLLGYREVIFISLELLHSGASTQVASLPHPHCLHQREAAGGGGND